MIVHLLRYQAEGRQRARRFRFRESRTKEHRKSCLLPDPQSSTSAEHRDHQARSFGLKRGNVDVMDEVCRPETFLITILTNIKTIDIRPLEILIQIIIQVRTSYSSTKDKLTNSDSLLPSGRGVTVHKSYT